MKWLVGFAVGFMAGVSVSAAPPALEARLATIRGVMADEVRFREERHSQILAQPAIFEGTLRYDSDAGVMSKIVESPVPISMTVDDRLVSIERDGKVRRIKLTSQPELRALLAGFRGLLTGDVGGLEKHFELSFTESVGGWRLRMVPRSRRLAKELEEMIVDGTDSGVAGICTRMANGDWQHMTLGDRQDSGE